MNARRGRLFPTSRQHGKILGVQRGMAVQADRVVRHMAAAYVALYDRIAAVVARVQLGRPDQRATALPREALIPRPIGVGIDPADVDAVVLVLPDVQDQVGVGAIEAILDPHEDEAVAAVVAFQDAQPGTTAQPVVAVTSVDPIIAEAGRDQIAMIRPQHDGPFVRHGLEGKQLARGPPDRVIRP